MIGSGNETTITGKKNQVMGVLVFIGGVVWWINGGDSLGQWLTLIGVIMWLWGSFKEWLGR
jgi:hypothetical protein